MGMHLDYTDLQIITERWWPKDIVGPVTYPRDLKGDQIDSVITAYLREICSGSLVRHFS